MSRFTFSPARLLAFHVLRDVAERDAYANLALQSRLREFSLTDQDAAFATELVSGSLRLAGRYDAIIELVTKRSTASLDPEVHTVLQLGAHQLLTLDTPAHAAIHEQVELAKHVAGQRTAGFVNGVLRTISRTSSDEWITRVSATCEDSRDELAAVESHPRWVVDALADALAAEGREEELRAALEANNAAPRVHLAFLTDDAPDGAHGLSPIGDTMPSGNPGKVIAEYARQGVVVRVQDQGSQLAALALARVLPPTPGERWLDLCAGPGGKTAVLVSEAERENITVRANEVSEHRTKLVRQSLRGLEEGVTVVTYDGRSEEAFGGQHYDRIMVDAPCSGLGALRRRPEARWRKQPEDIAPLVALQHELLRSATRHLAPGGVIAYVTCSPHIAETREVLETHLASHPELEELDTKSIISELVRTPIEFSPGDDSRAVQLWPHRDGTDAMFISLMRRTQKPQPNRMES